MLKVGDRSHDGRLEIAETSWDHNGTLTVTVRETAAASSADLPIDRARSLARRALMYPERTRSSRVLRRYTADGHRHVTFAVSRLEN